MHVGTKCIYIVYAANPIKILKFEQFQGSIINTHMFSDRNKAVY